MKSKQPLNSQQQEQDASLQTAKMVDTGLACLTLIAQFYEKPVNADFIKHQRGKNADLFDVEDILLSLKELALKARLKEAVVWEDLEHTPLPAIVLNQDGSFSVLAKAADEKVLLHSPVEQKPIILEKADFLENFSGQMILITRRAGIDSLVRKFDVRWFIPEIIKHKHLFYEVLMASLFVQILALLSPLFFQVVVDKVLVHHSLTTLQVLGVGLIAIAVGEALLGGTRAYVLAHTTSRIDVTLGTRLFKHLMNLPLAYFESRRIGDTVARVRELETIRNFLTGSALMAVLDALFIIVFLAVMMLYSVKLTLIVIATIPIYGLLCFSVAPVLRSRLEEKFFRGADNQAFLVESINGIETIKSSALAPQLQRRWEEQLAGYVQASFKTLTLGNYASQIAQFISKITTALILWIGAVEVINGHMTVGMLVAFNMFANQVVSPILRLAQLWQEFQQVGVSVERLGDVLNTPTEMNSGGISNLPQMKGHIIFEKVTFRYQPNTNAVLNNISLDIPAGAIIGLVGSSGSGKSTVTKLIQRLYVPEAGHVLIDGMDMARYNPAWLRQQLGVVLQENFLFNRSIRENIALSDPGMPFDRIIQASELAGAHEFIVQLPDGYETVLGERGCTLSGGQRQRLAIARALVTNPKVLIMDEATSALDYESERIIQENMKQICKGRTVIVIAHRLSAVRQADRIFVLDKGQISEQGTHAHLMKNKGIYAHLQSLQNTVD